MNRIKLSLQSAKKDFLDDFKPNYVMFWLIRDKVITSKESQDVLAKKSSQDQVEVLFEILASKGSKEFENFIKVLNMEDEDGVNYPWLAEKLVKTNLNKFSMERIPSLEDEVDTLIHGEIPFPINCLLPREKKVEEIREKLIYASYKRRWVILHGMTGTGKSVLAAEAVRDNELIKKYFPDGVFWVTLGNLIDSTALGMRIKRLLNKIGERRKILGSENKQISVVENMNDLKCNLRKIVSKKMLIILDDLWDSPCSNRLDVVKYFDIGCPILVTTKFPGEFEKYSQYTSKIECRNNLSIDESKVLLSLHVDCKSHELPLAVDAICRKSRGSPFTLSHIGRWMAPFGNDVGRWNHLKTLLEKGLSLAMRRRHSSDDELSEIKDIIRLTLKPIEEYEDYFFDFVIFPEDAWVPSDVFKVLWDLNNIYEVEETMCCLVQRSLVQEKDEKDPVCRFLYGIHDLYLEILKEMCNDKNERHQKLVNNYLKLCRKEDGHYDFSLLPDDDYIHHYIGYHMSSVGDNDILDGVTFDDIYFDLNFIEKKLRLEPRDLLWDYQNYRSLFKNERNLEVYKSFAYKHMYDFSNKDCDIIQLGLFEPADSVIYKKSLTIALKSETKAYFEWCNQEENQSHLQNLNLKLIPFENTRHAAISSDGLLIASVDDENKVWM